MGDKLVDFRCFEVFPFLKELFAFLPVKLVNLPLDLDFLHVFEFNSV